MCVRNWRYSLALTGLVLALGASERSIAEEAGSSLESKLANLEARIKALEKENAALKRKPESKPELSAVLGAKPSGTAWDAIFTARDKKELSNPPYKQARIPSAYQRQVVPYPRKEPPGSILVDTDARVLYYVLPEGKAIRYGAIVGEDSQAPSGDAVVGRKEEWPGWTPTEDEKRRLPGPLPNYLEGGAHNPMGARALYLYAGGKDTLYRIHGTNQPVLIGRAVSSGCIRLTNEDVIDLYARVKIGARVVVLGPASRVARAGAQVRQ